MNTRLAVRRTPRLQGDVLPELPGPSQPAVVIHQMLLVSKIVDRICAEQVRDLVELSYAEWRVVHHLGSFGPTSPARISAAAHADRAEVSRAVRSLECKGLLARHGNPKRRSSFMLELTAAGQLRFDQVDRSRQDLLAFITRDLASAELQHFYSCLRRLAHGLEALESKRVPRTRKRGRAQS